MWVGSGWGRDGVSGLCQCLQDDDEGDRAGTETDVLRAHAQLLIARVHHNVGVCARHGQAVEQHANNCIQAPHLGGNKNKEG